MIGCRYGFDAQTVEALGDEIQGMINTFKTPRGTFAPATRDQEVVKIKSGVARADAVFQSFLSRVGSQTITGAAPSADHPTGDRS